MNFIDEESFHPDLYLRDNNLFRLKPGIFFELQNLEQTKENASSSSELYWVEQKKLELFQRIFGF